MSIAEKRLKDIGISLPDDGKGIRTGRGTCTYKIHEDLLFIKGLEPYGDDGNPAFVGRLGAEFDVEQGYRAARLVGIRMLAVIRDALGSLDNVDCILKVMAMVNGVEGFTQLSEVADGFTDLLTEALGERGMHARSTMGATNLNNNVPVICDAIIKIR